MRGLRGGGLYFMKRLNNLQKFLERRKKLRNSATPQELLIWSKLKNSQLGFKFRRQHSIDGYIVDFYCPKKKLVIEIDGSQHFQKNNLEYDEIRSKFFKILNIKVIRFTNAEINTNIEGVPIRIKSEI